MEKIFEVPMYGYRRNADERADTVPRHPVVIIGAGPVGLAAGLDLALQDVPVVILDENDKVSWGSRAVCYAKRPLEILGRLGCGEESAEHGVQWHIGKVFNDQRQVYEFDLLPEGGHKYPAFVNLQQYHLEKYLVDRLYELQDAGKPIELRGRNKVTAVKPHDDYVSLTVETPEGTYTTEADWLIAADGANSPTRNMLNLDFIGQTFFDHFLICDVVMKKDFPAERWFWFDPPFNRGESVLLHKQADNVWRIDFQLGFDTDKEEEVKPENVIPRLKKMLGEDTEFDLEWVSVYTFNCRRLERFRHGRVLFAGDAAHQVSPFGARGANSGLQDTDNLAWKLKLVLDGKAPEGLLDTYDFERVLAAKENLLNSTRSTDFITPKSDASRAFRDAVLQLSGRYEFARGLVNSGRLSVPSIYDGSPLNGADVAGMPDRSRPGAPIPDAPVAGGWLIDKTGGGFQLMGINTAVPDGLVIDGIEIGALNLDSSGAPELAERFLGDETTAVYLLRPDQHVAARWREFNEAEVRAALQAAIGRNQGE